LVSIAPVSAGFFKRRAFLRLGGDNLALAIPDDHSSPDPLYRSADRNPLRSSPLPCWVWALFWQQALRTLRGKPGEGGMLNGKRVFVVMPAFNAVRTLRQTCAELPRDVVDEVLLVDDYSSDSTVQLARELRLTTFVHHQNLGYGRNQKTCYRESLRRGGDIVVMLHPDYQYSPRLVTAMVSMIAYGEYDLVLGSRILGPGALRGGMPLYKYLSNRVLTLFENFLLNYKVSEYHTGYRAFSRQVLSALPLEENSDDFVFDNELLAQAIYFGYRIGEISCPTRYFPEASSINFSRSVNYGLHVLVVSLKFRLQKMGLGRFRLLNSEGRKLLERYYDEVTDTCPVDTVG
jgi:glycosyltransferase involved in cell wall biosynthesis